MQSRFNAGKAIHARIESVYSDFDKDIARTFSTPELDFDLVFHADLFDIANQIVYEIKPQIWCLKHYDYCSAQLAGYIHMLEARAGVFLLYQYLPDNSLIHFPFHPPSLPSWDNLLEIARASDAMLLAKERQEEKSTLEAV